MGHLEKIGKKNEAEKTKSPESIPYESCKEKKGEKNEVLFKRKMILLNTSEEMKEFALKDREKARYQP